MTAASAAVAGTLPVGWDCHAHLFGPYDRYPLAGSAVHAPPPATDADYAALLRRLQLRHGVLVHPSAYGSDHRLLFDALAAHPEWRGVIVPTPGVDPSFGGLRERGVRGARFSHRPGLDFPGSPGLADLERLAPALADAGLHAELWTTHAALPDIAPRLQALPVPVVIDHMGGFDAAAGIDAPGFAALRRLLASGRAWVKLCAYRHLPAGIDPELGASFQQALQRENPSQLVWGSDWPHLRVQPVPDAADWLARCRAWAGPLAEHILHHNPQRLYG
ncbi:MAG: amidohydrolase family protein [Burkholderiaceae bacterium]|nr:amidohydrolase family protein [Rhodoferax sp.]MCP5285704.1 amidohydrolase family protein [Burkholderiaceae bacterium]